MRVQGDLWLDFNNIGICACFGDLDSHDYGEKLNFKNMGPINDVEGLEKCTKLHS